MCFYVLLSKKANKTISEFPFQIQYSKHKICIMYKQETAAELKHFTNL